MKSFDNKTKSSKEKAIKIGKNVPVDGVTLGYFSSEEITPENSLSIIDISETIPENKIRNVNNNEAIVAYADQFGVLFTEDGRNSFPADDLTIGDIYIDKQTFTERVDPSGLNPSSFVHYYYVSRYFAAASSSFTFFSIEDFISEEKINELNISVIDAQGKEYIDPNTNRKKYRILLEPYRSAINSGRSENPHRIIVLLDADKPSGLRLVYDKVESDSYGNFHSQVLNYTESINAVPYYNEVPEEAFVIDPNYTTERQFTIKKIDQKYSELVSKTPVQPGYQIIAPRKALKDNRNFEIFNWRLIARIRKKVNLDIIDFQQEIDQYGKIFQRDIKAAVLFSSLNGDVSNSVINPFIFRRLEASSFNINKHRFINPNSDQDKNSDLHWKVDIDNISSLSDYDILAWSPTSRITQSQALKIKHFLSRSGTLILDLGAGNIDASALDMQLQRGLSVKANYLAVNTSNALNDGDKNGGWPITDAIFEQTKFHGFLPGVSAYSVLGSAVTRGGGIKTYLPFKDAESFNSFINIGTTPASTSSVGMLLSYPNLGDSLSSGNIIATAYPLMGYCNNIYSLTNPDEVAITNYGSTFNPDPNFNVYSGVTEGPMKLLYNSILYALYCKARGNGYTDIIGTLYNFVTPWKSSWVMDETALFEEEKERFFTSITIDGYTTGLGRDLVPDKVSIFDYYKSELYKFLPPVERDMIANIDPTEVELFIEVTNIDVSIVNAERIDVQAQIVNEENIPTAYYLHRLIKPSDKLYAYTTKPSPELIPNSTMGTYAITEQLLSVSEFSTLDNRLSILNSFKSYPFKFTTRYSYLTAKDLPATFTIKSNNTFLTNYRGVVGTSTTICEPQPPTVETNPITIETDIVRPAVRTLSAVDRDIQNFPVDNINSPTNCFVYTGDIGIHKITDNWKVGSPKHDYVRYIQYSIAALSGQKITIDGIYGSQTAAAVRAFQINQAQRYIDGIVDSETKSFIALAWRRMKDNNRDLFNGWKELADPGIKQYIQAVEDMPRAGQIGDGRAYKKISFTKTAGASIATDIITFRVGERFDFVDKVVIERAGDSKWQNFVVDWLAYSPNEIKFADLYGGTSSTVKKVKLNKEDDYVCRIGGIKRDKADYMCVHITGGKIGDIFGPQAEGFGIKAITIYGRKKTTTSEETVTENPPICRVIDGATTIPVQASIVLPVSETISASTAFSGKTTNFTLSQIQKAPAYISQISYVLNGQTINKTFTPGEMPVGSTYSAGGLSVQFAGSTSASLKTSAIISIIGSDNKTYPNKIMTITPSSNVSGTNCGSYILKAVLSEFDDLVLKTSSTQVGTNYFLRDRIGRIFPKAINTVTVNDGILLLCRSDGSNIGVITADIINAAMDSNSDGLIEEIDPNLGIVQVVNDLGDEQGFIYGYYDIAQNEFIGKSLPYFEILARGPRNIYIGVCAIDADGNTQNSNEYLGPSVDMTYVPVNIPIKTLVPIYSLKYSNSAAIKVGAIPGGLSRFDSWHLPVTNGSFTRVQVLNPALSYSDWKEEYKGQSLFAVYSTIDATFNSPSDIFGTGFYDVIDERPIILSSQKIQARRYPILSWNHPTNYRGSQGIVRPELRIYIKESGIWNQVEESEIRDVNCETGIIEFNSRIVPTNTDLIKITYVTSNKDHLVRQVNGAPVPLNPLLNKNDINYSKPMYIYLTPTVLYKLASNTYSPNLSREYTRVVEYTNASPINYTFDTRIFNQSSGLYDPFALPIAIVYVTANPKSNYPSLSDVRRRGGGFKDVDRIRPIIEKYPDITSHWDVYPPSGKAYPKGGYVIIRIPESVRNHFNLPEEIYNIIRSNLTAGVAFDLQDLEGNSWS